MLRLWPRKSCWEKGSVSGHENRLCHDVPLVRATLRPLTHAHPLKCDLVIGLRREVRDSVWGMRTSQRWAGAA